MRQDRARSTSREPARPNFPLETVRIDAKHGADDSSGADIPDRSPASSGDNGGLSLDVHTGKDDYR